MKIKLEEDQWFVVETGIDYGLMTVKEIEIPVSRNSIFNYNYICYFGEIYYPIDGNVVSGKEFRIFTKNENNIIYDIDD